MHALDATLYDFHILLHILLKKNMTMVILTMASVQEQGENEQKKQEFNAVYCSCPSRQTA